MAELVDKLIVCTLSDADKGPAACPHCGYLTGTGHGKARG